MSTRAIIHRYKNYSIFLLLFSLNGCSKCAVFEPNELPDGHVGKEYYVPISISGGTGPVVDLTYEINPSNSGIKLVFIEKDYHSRYIYNDFTIQGKPQSKGVVVISIKGGMVASAGKNFERTYRINVLE